MTPMQPATLQEARLGRIDGSLDEAAALMSKTNPGEMQAQVASLLSQFTPEQLAAGLLASVAGLEKQNAPVTLSRERPLPRRKGGRGGSRGGYRGGNRRGNGGYRGHRDGERRGNGGYRGRRDGDRRSNGNGGGYRGNNHNGERRGNGQGRKRDFTVREKG